MFKLIRYHFPPIVKHVLAPQDDFGMQKKNMLNRQKKVGLGQTPPPSMGKIPTFYRFFSGGPPLLSKYLQQLFFFKVSVDD